jgi:dihydrofolate reductase
MVTQIVAFDEDRGIGKTGHGIPWKYPKDLSWFRFHTTGSVCVVGRKTFENMGALSNRSFLVLTRNPKSKSNKNENVRYLTLDQLKSVSGQYDNLYICGGSSIYRQTVDRLTDQIIVTRVPGTHGCDVFYPEIPGKFQKQATFKTQAQDGTGTLTFEKWIDKT